VKNDLDQDKVSVKIILQLFFIQRKKALRKKDRVMSSLHFKAILIGIRSLSDK